MANFLAFAEGKKFSLTTAIRSTRPIGRFDYVNGRSDPSFVPFTGTLTVGFPASIWSVRDYGETTITQFGDDYGTSIVSPVTPLIGVDPYGGGIGSGVSYAFAHSDDYPNPDNFLEGFAALRSAYSPTPSYDRFWHYTFELRAVKRSPAQNGDGTSDYAFSTVTLLAFLTEFKSAGREAIFGESFEIFEQASSPYSDGFGWEGTATLATITVVPESRLTGVCFAVVILLFGIFQACRRRNIVVTV